MMTSRTQGDDRPGTIQHWLFVGATALGAVAITLWTQQRTTIQPDLIVALGYATAFFAARLLTIRLPQGDEVSVTLMVGLVGLTMVNLPLLVAASFVAGLVDMLARFAQSARSASIARLRDVIRGSAILGLLAPWQLVLNPLVRSGAPRDEIVLWAIAAGAAYAALDLFTQGVEQSFSTGLAVWEGAASLARPLGSIYVVHMAMGAVVLRLQPVAGIWPFPVAILLTLILQNSFNLYMRIRRAYAETIGALANAAELDRPQDAGHARRVSDLAVAVGRRIGLASHELESIGFAALLHDIGRMGATGDESSQAHLSRGAEIAASIPFLADVAPLIMWKPQDEGETPPVGWVIVRTCSRYDRLRSELGAAAALEALVRDDGPADARVLETLEDILHSGRDLSEALP